MRRVTQRKRFRDDLKRQRRRGKNIDDLVAVIELLAEERRCHPALALTDYPANGAAFGSVT